MSKLLVYNVEQGGEAGLDWDYVTQQIDDDDGTVLRSNSMVVLISDDADNDLAAEALQMIAEDLREYGVRQLYKSAVVKIPT